MSRVTHIAGRLAATVGAWLVMSVGVAHGADAPREVHGAADAYAEPGIALAWGVLRGADEASTRVMLRIVADPARYPRLAVVGRDPFTQAERVVPGAAVDRRAARPRHRAHPLRRLPAHRAAFLRAGRARTSRSCSSTTSAFPTRRPSSPPPRPSTAISASGSGASAQRTGEK